MSFSNYQDGAPNTMALYYSRMCNIEEENGQEDEDTTVDCLGDEWAVDDLDFLWGESNEFTSVIVTTCSSEEVQLRKRIRKKRPRKVPFIPRIVKHDVRRFYSTMMVNAFNSHDIAFLRSFLETYAHRDLVSRQTRLNADFDKRKISIYNTNEGQHFSLVGVQALIEYESILHQLNPDQAISLKDTTIKTRSDSDKSEICCRLEVQFTRLYDIGSQTLYDDIIHNLVLKNKCATLENEQIASTDKGELQLLEIQDKKVSELNESVAGVSSVSLSTLSETSSVNDNEKCRHPSLQNDKDDNNRVMSVLTKHAPLAKLDSNFPDVFAYYLSSKGSHIPRIAEPKTFVLTTLLTIGLNERRQIESFQFENPTFCPSRK